MASGISFQLVGDVGDHLGTSSAFRGTVEAVDETNTKCLYAIPFKSSKIVKYNPSTDETTLIDFETTSSNAHHFNGGVVARDNKIYMSPCFATRILMLDPKTNTATSIGQDLGTKLCNYYTGAVCNEDGSEVYFTPYGATKILKLDIGTQTTSFVGGDLGNGYKWDGGGAVLNGNIYFAPCNATQVLQFNISTGKTCRVGDKYDGNNKWSGAVSCNGKDVYFIPYKHHQILKLDTETMQTQLVGPSFGDRQYKFLGGVQLSNETICMIPFYGADQITFFNPSNEQINRIGDFNGDDKSWACPVLTSNGTIYAAPYNASQFMHVKVDTFIEESQIANESQTKDTKRNYHFDAFLTHNWGKDSENHERVVRFKKKLEAQSGIGKLWLDEERMTGNIGQQMSSGIEQSKLVIVFITKTYIDKAVGRGYKKEKDNCYLEFNYAANRKGGSKLIAVVMEESCTDNSEWDGVVGMHLGTHLYYSFTKDSKLDKCVREVAEEMRKRMVKL